MANTLRIHVEDEKPLKLGFEDDITLKYVGADHTKLDNLDYEHSGHTGFMPAKLSILPDVSQDIPNGRLVLSAFDSETNESGKITFENLINRIIKTNSGEIPQNAQKGQYIFQEIKGE